MKYALLLLLLPMLAYAAEEMEMLTDAGAITLYSTPCPHTTTKQGFDYAAQATDGAVIHLGCWGNDGGSVHIWFYNEPKQPFIASIGKYYFKQKRSIE